MNIDAEYQKLRKGVFQMDSSLFEDLMKSIRSDRTVTLDLLIAHGFSKTEFRPMFQVGNRFNSFHHTEFHFSVGGSYLRRPEEKDVYEEKLHRTALYHKEFWSHGLWHGFDSGTKGILDLLPKDNMKTARLNIGSVSHHTHVWGDPEIYHRVGLKGSSKAVFIPEPSLRNTLVFGCLDWIKRATRRGPFVEKLSNGAYTAAEHFPFKDDLLYPGDADYYMIVEESSVLLLHPEQFEVYKFLD